MSDWLESIALLGAVFGWGFLVGALLTRVKNADLDRRVDARLARMSARASAINVRTDASAPLATSPEATNG